MIAFPKKNKENIGGQGGKSYAIDLAKEPRLLERATRQGWKMPEGIMDRLPESMKDVALNKKASHRNRIAAARVLTVMHGQNQADDPAPQTHRHEGVIDVRAIRQQIIDDNILLDSYGGSADDNGESGSVCTICKPGKMDVGKTPEGIE
jgi:hypothetical protein